MNAHYTSRSSSSLPILNVILHIVWIWTLFFFFFFDCTAQHRREWLRDLFFMTKKLECVVIWNKKKVSFLSGWRSRHYTYTRCVCWTCHILELEASWMHVFLLFSRDSEFHPSLVNFIATHHFGYFSLTLKKLLRRSLHCLVSLTYKLIDWLISFSCYHLLLPPIIIIFFILLIVIVWKWKL